MNGEINLVCSTQITKLRLFCMFEEEDLPFGHAPIMIDNVYDKASGLIDTLLSHRTVMIGWKCSSNFNSI